MGTITSAESAETFAKKVKEMYPDPAPNVLPCPFCGSDKIFIGSHGQAFEARCCNCGVSTAKVDWNQSFYDDDGQSHYDRNHEEQYIRGNELALRLWNRRV